MLHGSFSLWSSGVLLVATESSESCSCYKKLKYILPKPWIQPVHLQSSFGFCVHYIKLFTSVCCSILASLNLYTAHISRHEQPQIAEALVPSVMLLPAGRGRAEEKQNRTSSDLSGEQPLSSSSALGGKTHQRKRSRPLLLSPLFCPGPALLSLGHVLLFASTPPFLHHSELNSDECHLAQGDIRMAACFP